MPVFPVSFYWLGIRNDATDCVLFLAQSAFQSGLRRVFRLALAYMPFLPWKQAKDYRTIKFFSGGERFMERNKGDCQMLAVTYNDSSDCDA